MQQPAIKNQMFKRQNLKIPLVTVSFLSPIKAAELLAKAFQMQSVGFEYCILDKPVNGSVLIHHNQKNELNEDGYGWLDNEEIQKFTLENGIEIEIISRNLGFGLGDTHTSVYHKLNSKRKRYRLVQNRELELLQYLKPAEQGAMVQMHLVKVRPSNLGNIQNQVQNLPTTRTPNRPPMQLNQPQPQPKKLKVSHPVKVVEEERDPEGGLVD